MMPRNVERDRVAKAISGSKCAEARLWGMKHRAKTNPPTAAARGFPYPARTCAEWKEAPSGQILEIEQTDEERQIDAETGSAKLRDAIRAMAA